MEEDKFRALVNKRNLTCIEYARVVSEDNGISMTLALTIVGDVLRMEREANEVMKGEAA